MVSLALEVVRPTCADVGLQRHTHYLLGGKCIGRVSEDFGGLARVSSGNQKIGRNRHSVPQKRAQHRETPVRARRQTRRPAAWRAHTRIQREPADVAAA